MSTIKKLKTEALVGKKKAPVLEENPKLNKKNKKNLTQEEEALRQEALKQENINISKVLLKTVEDFLKSSINGILQLPTRAAQAARSMTIKRKPYANAVNDTAPELLPEDTNTPVPIQPGVAAVAPSLSITIRGYRFTLISKCVLFDRKYVNFDVYKIFNAEDVEAADDVVILIGVIRWKLIHTLTAYGSSSQVGSWRLCKLEAGNRLNKFDDYVQSTVLQWELARFICYWFYRYQLPWDDEPEVRVGQVLNPNEPDDILSQDQADQMNARINARNLIRNNLFCVRPLAAMPDPVQPLIIITNNPNFLNYTLLPPPGYLPHNIQQPGVYNLGDLSAIPYVYVMDGGQYQYQTLPIQYVARTLPDPDPDPDQTITCKIVDRGLGSVNKYSANYDICHGNRGPLPAPCPFTYWTPARGNCGNQIMEGIIKQRLRDFSTALNAFYEILNVDGHMAITELYRDCMIYKNFKQEATIFKVTLVPKVENNVCIPPNGEAIHPNLNPIAFYKQQVDIVFVNYSIKQYTSFPTVCLSPCYSLDPQPIVAEYPVGFDINAPEFNVQGYYVLTIIPTRVLLPQQQLLPQEVIHCDFNNITEIGLFQYYIKAGFYVCKPLDYRGQCMLRSFPTVNYPDRNIGNQIITTINMEYAYIGHRLNSEEPFKTLFGWTIPEKNALSIYSEQIISSPATTVGTLIRQMTNAKSDAEKQKTLINQLNEPCYENRELLLRQIQLQPIQLQPIQLQPIVGGHYRMKRKTAKKCNRRKRKTNKRRKRKTQKKHKRGKTKKVRSRS